MPQLADVLIRRGAEPLILQGEQSWGMPHLAAFGATMDARFPDRRATLTFQTANDARVVALALWSALRGRNLALLSPELRPDAVAHLQRLVDSRRLTTEEVATLGPSSVTNWDSPVADGTCFITTTGSTGMPKTARYSWDDLMRQAKSKERFHRGRWLLTYNLAHFAGMQVFASALRNEGTLVLPQTPDRAGQEDAIRRHRPSVASGTPTFWRNLLLGWTGSAAPDAIQQIVLGGEPASQATLDLIRRSFPSAAITQTYATTETGPVFSVNDGKAGFPVTFLAGEHRAVSGEMRVRDGELLVRTASRMRAYVDAAAPWEDDGWYATGDLVRHEGDRVLFVGRRTFAINVGGVKVHPRPIEEVLESVPGVEAARVIGRPNPVTGQIVRAEIVVAPGHDAGDVLARARDACSNRLSRSEVPRSWATVDALPNVNQKIMRGT